MHTAGLHHNRALVDSVTTALSLPPGSTWSSLQPAVTTSSSLLGHDPELSHKRHPKHERVLMIMESDNESSVHADLFALPVAVMTAPSQYLLPFPFPIPYLLSLPLLQSSFISHTRDGEVFAK